MGSARSTGRMLARVLGAALVCVALPGCSGLNNALGALARAIFIGVMIVAGSAAIVMLTLVIAWGVAFVRGLRGSTWSAAVSVGLALVWLVVQIVVALLLEGLSFGDVSVATWLGAAAMIPALALGASVSLLIRRRSQHATAWMALGVAPVLAVGLGLLGFRMTHVEWRELPGRVTQFAGTILHECALLSSGQVACIGANYDGQLGTGGEGSAHVPGPVVGLDDATSIAVADGVSCALRSAGDAVCWGGSESLHPPSDALRPWRIPESEGAIELAVTSVEVVGRREDGTTFGWPHPLPPSLGRARLVTARDTIDGRAIWHVSTEGLATYLEWSRDGDLDGVEPHPELGDVVELAPNDDGTGCARRSDDSIICLRRGSYDDTSPLVHLTAPGLRSLVVLDGMDPYLCGLDGLSVRCFSALGAEIQLSGHPQAASISTLHYGLCGLRPDGESFCTAPAPRDIPTSDLLPFDRQP